MTASPPVLFEEMRPAPLERVRVLLPLPVGEGYDYALPQGVKASSGQFVRVPLGPREVMGVVRSDPPDASVPDEKLRPVTEVLTAPPLSRDTMDFVDWVAGYTLFSRGVVLRMVMRSGQALAPVTPQTGYRLAPGGAAPPGKITAQRAAVLAAAPAGVLDHFAPVMEAVSANIHRVGTEPGDGQTVKACLQSLIGAQFSATFEAAALAAKAGVPGQVILDVFSTSSAGCGIVNNALQKIIDRQFEGTGSHINTMHKDLTISMALGEELGVPLHTAAAAMQIFPAGRTRHPAGDNWVATRVIEDIVGAELHRDAARKTRGDDT